MIREVPLMVVKVNDPFFSWNNETELFIYFLKNINIIFDKINSLSAISIFMYEMNTYCCDESIIHTN